MGYRFTPTFVQNILLKYDPRTRRLTLDNFIVCCVQIKRLTGISNLQRNLRKQSLKPPSFQNVSDSFRVRDREMRGTATMQYEDFIGLAMGAHK